MKKTCHQCHKELDKLELSHQIRWNLFVYVCENPKCPNYALIQIPLEDMKEGKKNIDRLQNHTIEIRERIIRIEVKVHGNGYGEKH